MSNSIEDIKKCENICEFDVDGAIFHSSECSFKSIPIQESNLAIHQAKAIEKLKADSKKLSFSLGWQYEELMKRRKEVRELKLKVASYEEFINKLLNRTTRNLGDFTFTTWMSIEERGKVEMVLQGMSDES